MAARAWEFMPPIVERTGPIMSTAKTSHRMPSAAQEGRIDDGVQVVMWCGAVEKATGLDDNLPRGIISAMNKPHLHASHPAVIKRLRKANGHLSSTIDMLEQGRTCLDVAQQLQAVEKAIQQAKKALIQDHLDHCLEDLVGPLGAGQRHTMDEFREITRYL
jgi:uncharacterized protein